MRPAGSPAKPSKPEVCARRLRARTIEYRRSKHSAVGMSCDLGQVDAHRLAADEGHDDGGTHRARWADCAEQVGAVMPIVAHRGGTRAAWRPQIGQRALLAHAGFVLEPDLDRLAGRLGRQHLGYAGGEVFLNASCASAFFFG